MVDKNADSKPKEIILADCVQQIFLNLNPPRKIHLIATKQHGEEKNYIVDITKNSKIQLTKNS